MEKHHETTADKLKRYSKLDPDTGCLIWLKGKGTGGRGMIWMGKKRTRYAHIIAWECVYGPRPEGFTLHRTCGNRLCINVQHMVLFKSSVEDSESAIERQLNRLKRKMIINSVTQCWEWQGAKTPKGYGVLQDGVYTAYAHRMMWECLYGKINELHVLHKCDNPCCINPEHLFLGTNTDNMWDKINKNRAGYKLKIEDIQAIRASELPPKELAAKYGVRINCIYNVLNRKTWKHVK